MTAIIQFLTMFAAIALVFLTAALCVEIAKSTRENNRKGLKQAPKLNTAEFIFVIFCFLIWLGLMVYLPKENLGIIGGLGAGFGGILGAKLSNQSKQNVKPKNKYPTIADIQRKYPKRKPVEIPSDGIYEDFSREVVPIETETITLEIPESSFNRLLELVRDKDKAIDGILQTMKAYPTKSATWCCEKEISRIEDLIEYKRQAEYEAQNPNKDRDSDRYI